MQDSSHGSLCDGQDLMEQQAQAFDGDNVIIAVSILIAQRTKQKFPLWHTALDWVMTLLYFAVITWLGVKIVHALINWLLG